MHATVTAIEPRVHPSGSVAGLVLTDAHWVVSQISLEGPGLAADPADLVGGTILDVVHPADRPDLHTAGDLARRRRTTVHVLVQLGAPGAWVPARVTITPMVDGQLGLLLDAVTDGQEDRATRLEQHLWKIAREIEAAGLAVEGAAPLVDPTLLIEDLSPRQEEILRRLLQGQRVPGIARALFLSASTVRNHLTAIFAKLGVHSQEQLIELLRTNASTTPSPA